MSTAEEILIQACRDAGFTDDYSRAIFRIYPDSSSAYVEAIKKFAKLHVKACKKEISKQISSEFPIGEKVINESILNCYPETNIK